VVRGIQRQRARGDSLRAALGGGAELVPELAPESLVAAPRRRSRSEPRVWSSRAAVLAEGEDVASRNSHRRDVREPTLTFVDSEDNELGLECRDVKRAVEC